MRCGSVLVPQESSLRTTPPLFSTCDATRVTRSLMCFCKCWLRCQSEPFRSRGKNRRIQDSGPRCIRAGRRAWWQEQRTCLSGDELEEMQRGKPGPILFPRGEKRKRCLPALPDVCLQHPKHLLASSPFSLVPCCTVLASIQPTMSMKAVSTVCFISGEWYNS